MARSAGGLWIGRRAGGGGETLPTVPPVYIAPPSLSPSSYVVYVGNRSGLVIGELSGALESVTWAVDGYGTAAMILPTDAPDYQHLLAYGNRVFIDFSNGLPPWGGVIDVPRETTLGQTRVQMYEATYLLGWDWTEPLSYTAERQLPVGAVLADLVGRSSLDIEVGPLDDDTGEAAAVEFDNESLLAAAEKLRGLDARLHYRVRARPIRGQRIQFALEVFCGALSDDVGPALFIQGQNMVQWEVLEQGPIWNEVTVSSQSAAAADDSGRFLCTVVDADSALRYGVRRRPPQALPDVDEDATPGRTEAQARAILAATHMPRMRAHGTLLNQEPGLYRSFGIGSRVAVEITRPAAARLELVVIGMEFRPAAGTLSLVFDDADRVEV